MLLLNRVLTVAPGQPASHRGRGWEAVTEQAIRALVARPEPLVAILWGRDARNLGPLLGDTPRIESAHPSPLSAGGGFFGSRPFSRTNQLLAELGADPVDWRLTVTPVATARWTELDPRTLYALLRLRVDVFVVEQNCPYPELDGRDLEASTVHVWTSDNAGPTAYLRILSDGVDGATATGSTGTAATGSTGAWRGSDGSAPAPMPAAQGWRPT